MDRKDWPLLALAFAEDYELTPARLQKSLFLLGEELEEVVGPDFYTFVPYDFGPFDKQIYSDLEAWEEEGLVSEDDSGRGKVRKFSLTPRGQEKAEELKERAPSEGIDYLGAVVHWAEDQSFQSLVKSIYDEYPEYRENSVFIA